jgi:retinol dehydrogenase-12
MIPPIDQVTVDGYNLQFGTNTLGHFFFTSLLLPVLLSTAKQAPGEVRVVSVSSMAHIGIKGIKWDTLKDTPARRKLSPDALYGQSKLVSISYLRLINTYSRNPGSHPILERACEKVRKRRNGIDLAASR